MLLKFKFALLTYLLLKEQHEDYHSGFEHLRSKMNSDARRAQRLAKHCVSILVRGMRVAKYENGSTNALSIL